MDTILENKENKQKPRRKYTTSKRSINAIETAREVSEIVRAGKPLYIGQVVAKRYSKSVADSPQRVTQTKSYQETIQPVIRALEKEREAILLRLPQVRHKARYRDLTDGLDKVTKNIQLLSGKSTDNVAVIPLTNLFVNGVQNSNSNPQDSEPKE